MTELESRIIATRIVEALHAHGEAPREIFVGPHGAGLCVRVELNGPVVECHIPPGAFDYGRVADALVLAKGQCQLETS